MKKLLGILVLIFTLQTPSLADDISDFEIEGMSVGDSALDFFSETEIKKKIDNNDDLISYPSSNEYYGMVFENKNFFQTYESIKVHFKENDKNFIFVGVTGQIDYPNNFEDCLKTKKKIVKEIKESFNFNNIRNYTNDFGGKGGTSIAYLTDFDFSSGDAIRVWCSKWDKKNENTKYWLDSLNVGVSSKELLDFLQNKAYK